MALMEALLKIKADVQGEGQVNALGRAIGGVGATASKVTGALRGMASGAGTLAGAMGTLTPLLSAAGLIGLAKSSLDAGNKMFDLSQKTGVSVEALAKFKKAAAVSGTTIDTVGTALARLSKAMVAASSTVKGGEKTQTEIVKEQAERRVEALERESDQRLRELNKRYRREEKLLGDRFDDEASRQQDAAEAQQRIEERSIEQQFNARRAAIENDKSLTDAARAYLLENLRYQEEDANNALRDSYERQATERRRALRDRLDAEQEAIQERKFNEEQALKQSIETQKTAVKDAVKAYDPMSEALEDLGISGKGASKAFQALGIAIKNEDGSIKSADAVMLAIATKFKAMPDGVQKTALAMQLFGRSGAEMIPMLNMGGDAIEKMKVKMTEAFAQKADEYSDKLTTLSGKIGAFGMDLIITLLPTLEAITNAMTGLIDGFNKLPEPIRAIVGGIALLSIGFVALSPLINGVVQLLTIALPLLATIGPTIAGWLGAVGPAVAGMTAALSGLLAWVSGTMVPALLTFFSGPVGWTVLAVAAVVAMCVAFREPIGQFFSWLGGAIGDGLDALWKWAEPIRSFWAGIWQAVYAITWQAFVQPWINLWDLIKTPLTNFGAWIGGLFSSIWKSLVAGAKSAFSGVLQYIADRINSVGQLINRLIGTFNKLPGPDIPMVPTVTVPAFAQGGYVNRPTLAMVGEAGPEYIIPAGRMAQASASFLAGARGGAMPQGAGGVSLNVQTGPVLQQGGQRYVTLSDLEKAMRATAEGVMNRMRTPAARYATGIR